VEFNQVIAQECAATSEENEAKEKTSRQKYEQV
jgi:hypothetical protein